MISSSDSVSPKTHSECESNFKTISRNIITIGANLGSGKDSRDFFIHLVEKVIEPLKQMQLDEADVELFLNAYLDAVTTKVLQVDDNVVRALQKFMETLIPCVLTIY